MTAGWATVGEDWLPAMIGLRREIHADPELGLHCPRTRDRVKAALTGLDLEFREGSSTTGIVVVLRGQRRTGRTVLLRADTDALPIQERSGSPFASRNEGVMHACGHDAHTAMLVGAALMLSAQRERLAGDVYLMFQPGEEGFHGARFMLEDGLLDGPRPDAAFALHVAPNLPSGTVACRSGPIHASSDRLRAVVRGRGGHAAMPHANLDPIPVACEMVLALQAFVARQVSVFDPAVLSISQIAAGTTDNITPDTAELLGTLRTLSETTREKAHEAFGRIAHHVAAAHGLEAKTEIERGFPVAVNDGRAVALVERLAVAIVGDSSWLALREPLMAAEDFAYVLAELPGAIALLGAAPGGDPRESAALHNPAMTIREEVMARGAALHCAFAETFLKDGFDGC